MQRQGKLLIIILSIILLSSFVLGDYTDKMIMHLNLTDMSGNDELGSWDWTNNLDAGDCTGSGCDFESTADTDHLTRAYSGLFYNNSDKSYALTITPESISADMVIWDSRQDGTPDANDGDMIRIRNNGGNWQIHTWAGSVFDTGWLCDDVLTAGNTYKVVVAEQMLRKLAEEIQKEKEIHVNK